MKQKEQDYPFAGKLLCPFCGKRAATRLCDAPIRRLHWIGHPPRYLSRGGATPWEYPMHETITCDKPICEKCSTQIGADIDYCPDCIQRIIMAARPKGKEPTP